MVYRTGIFIKFDVNKIEKHHGLYIENTFGARVLIKPIYDFNHYPIRTIRINPNPNRYMISILSH